MAEKEKLLKEISKRKKLENEYRHNASEFPVGHIRGDYYSYLANKCKNEIISLEQELEKLEV